MLRIFFAIIWTAAVFAAEAPEKQVDSIFAEYARPGSPGCAVGVLQRGETVLAKGYGFGDLEQNVSLSPRTRFYMASVSKQFTSMALLLAEQEGKLRLDDSIRKYVPELPMYAGEVTIRRSLDHTAGFRDYLSLWSMRGFSNESVLQEGPTLAMIARQKALNFAPGTDRNYSNTGYLLAAIALRRVTGTPLEKYAQERIFQPLEMHSTRFQADHGDPVPNRAHGYQRRGGVWKTVDIGFDVIGSGGMYSNIEDMLRWARNFEKPVIGAALLQSLQTPGKLIDGRPTPGGYALGLIERDGTYSHSGGATGYSTYFLRVPKSEVTVVCLCNIGAAPVSRLAEQVATVYTGHAIPSGQTPVPPESPAKPGNTVATNDELNGSYWSEELFSVWRFARRDGKLWLHSDGPEIAVTPAGDGAYKADGFQIKPIRDASGRVTGFTAGVGRAQGISFARR